MSNENENRLMRVRHSTAHILAAAVLKLFPDTKIDIGPATESGFYYDFDSSHVFTADDLRLLEREMAALIGADLPFIRSEVSRDQAGEIFRRWGQHYKLERLDDIPEGEVISLYRVGDFTDLCRGPHVSSSREISAFRLLSVAGAYYRGNEANRQLQRIYGTAFLSQEDLDRHLEQLEEAKRRDHRKLGRELKLFHIDEEVGAGLILWLPRGTIIRNELQRFILEELTRHGYDQVMTPHIAKLDLFRTSGHFPYYRESQFAPIVDREDLRPELPYEEVLSELEGGRLKGFLLKPMNCPGHIKIYGASPKSYRDLPCRYAEFGTVYRWEQSGELTGMTRVRGFTQDDAHIFCTEDQLESEICGCLNLVNRIFDTLGISEYRVRVSLRDPKSDKYIGTDEAWEKSEAALRQAVKVLGVPFREEVGEAAFYGPKIDFVIRDVIGREWQLGTIQVDYNLPERFDLTYIGADNRPHRPIMIHRAPFGSLERFCGLLIEHFSGDFPLWLAPEQVRILPVSDDCLPYAEEMRRRFREAGIRISIDDHSDKLGAKIRRAESEKVPYAMVLGSKEVASNRVSLRSRIARLSEATLSPDECLRMLLTDIENRVLPAGFGDRR